MIRKHHKKRVISAAVLTPCILLAIFLVPKKTLATPQSSPETYLSYIAGGLWWAVNAESKKELLETYCETMNNEDVQAWFMDKDALYYSPKFSLFVAALCGEITKKPKSFYTDNKLIGNISWDEILKTQIPWCDPDKDMKTCDLSQLLPALFKASMNDHSTLSVAWWAIQWDVKDRVKQFSDTYFSGMKDICWEADAYYISSKGAANEKNALCAHPITNQTLKNTISMLEQQMKNLHVVQWDQWNKLKTDNCKKSETSYENMVGCAYTNSTSQDAIWFQYNLWYNELMYYKLLLTWLANDKLKDPRVAPFIVDAAKKVQNLENKNAIEITDEIMNLNRELVLSENAIQIMEKSIANIRSTFPIHIWLQAYYEDAVKFRDTLVKVYTPIHQLNYKLRNIQDKK